MARRILRAGVMILLCLWGLPALAAEPATTSAPTSASATAQAPTPATAQAPTSTASPAPATAPGAVTAGEAPPPEALKTLDVFTGRNALGAMAGLGSGIGLSYRRYLTDAFALRGAGYVVLIDGAVDAYDFGLNAQFDFRRDVRYVLYVIGGLGLSHARFGDEAENEPLVNVGLFPNAGVGIELGNHEQPGLTYQLELALTAFIVDGSFQRLLPLPQVGIHYIF